MVDESVRDVVAAVQLWRMDSRRDLKRARMSIVGDGMYHLKSGVEHDVQGAYKSISQTSSLFLTELHSKRRQKKYKEEAPDARSRRFEAERRKYALLLSQVIIDADLPIVSLVTSLEDPKAAWVHLFAGRRGNTLKNRYKSWAPFAAWLELRRGRKFPRNVRDVIDYVQFRVDEGCGRTVPESLHIALLLLEQLGRVPEDSRISSDPLSRGHVKAWTAELTSEAPPRKPAEMYTVAMLISLEILVCAEEARLFDRALAWVVLVMIWAALRCDDVQSILPHRMLLSNFGLRVVLGRSKTTGPDKAQEEVAAHVLRSISLTGVDWIGEGFEIWTSEPFDFRRDFLVMEPNKDWTGPKRKFVTPSGLSSLIGALLSNIETPRRRNPGWDVNMGSHLLPDGLEKFFTGHSPRNFLTSVAAVLGFSKDERAYLGRWMMGSVSAEEYVRTSRQVIYKIQRSVNRALLEGRDEQYFEDEQIDRLCAFAESTGANPNRIRKRHSVMNNVSGRCCLGGIYPALEINLEEREVVDNFIDDDDDKTERVAFHSRKDAEGTGVVTKYFITVSRRVGLRKLHLTGCFVRPDRCLEVIYADHVNSEDFDSICKPCKRRMLTEGGKDQAESSSTASSSSTESGQAREEEFEILT